LRRLNRPADAGEQRHRTIAASDRQRGQASGGQRSCHLAHIAGDRGDESTGPDRLTRRRRIARRGKRVDAAECGDSCLAGRGLEPIDEHASVFVARHRRRVQPDWQAAGTGVERRHLDPRLTGAPVLERAGGVRHE
jgi:hypothetical protein